MAFDIKKFVANAHDPRFAELYEGINNLVNTAGHVTIAELFTKSRRELGPEVWEAIQKAKPLGFLNFSNSKCCQSGKCESRNRGWCSDTDNQECAAASDPCESIGQGARTRAQAEFIRRRSTRLVER